MPTLSCQTPPRSNAPTAFRSRTDPSSQWICDVEVTPTNAKGRGGYEKPSARYLTAPQPTAARRCRAIGCTDTPRSSRKAHSILSTSIILVADFTRFEGVDLAGVRSAPTEWRSHTVLGPPRPTELPCPSLYFAPLAAAPRFPNFNGDAAGGRNPYPSARDSVDQRCIAATGSVP